MRLGRWGLLGLVITSTLAWSAPAIASQTQTGVPANAAGGGTVDTISGMPAATSASSLGSKAELMAAVTPIAESQSVPITSAEETRLKWLATGHLEAMTLYDAAVGAELLPLTAQTSTISAVSQPVPLVNTGNCYEGVKNVINYNDVVGFTFTVVAGQTGICDGPGNGAIVAQGNWIDDVNDGIPDGCTASHNYYRGGEVYNGSNPEWLHQLNIAEVGLNTPFGCGGLGSLSTGAAALRQAYQGYWDWYNDFGFGGQPGLGAYSFIAGPYTCCSKVT